MRSKIDQVNKSESLLKHRDLGNKGNIGCRIFRGLNNFRYVLDNKIEELTQERPPQSTLIEAHIKDMYDELVNEFAGRNLKIDTLTKESQLQTCQIRESFEQMMFESLSFSIPAS